MKKSEINTLNAPGAIGPYSQAIEIGNTVYVSGQIPVNPEDGTIPITIEEQAHQALKNMGGILEAAGLDYANVVKTTVFLTALSAFNTVNTVYAEYFAKPYPARSCIEVSALPKGVLLEVECIAVK